MYKKMFELIDNELNSILENKRTYELVKLEVKGNKVKFVFLNHNNLIVITMFYELDWLSPEPKLKFKKDYIKPFKDKYFR
jgi:hypothetical protein